MRDVLRAELKADTGILKAEMLTLRTEMKMDLTRVENKVDHLADEFAKHIQA